MISMDAVIEVFGLEDFPAWPVSDNPEYRFVQLSDRMSDEEIGSVMAVIADYNRLLDPDDEEDDDTEIVAGLTDPVNAATAEAVFERLIAAECVIAPGGVRVLDQDSHATVSPGCCCGLEAWREDWFGVLLGREPWLGHNPTPDIQLTDEVICLRPRGREENAPAIEIPLTALPDMLAGVEHDLTGFLAAVSGWARALAPDLTDDLVAALDRNFQISAAEPVGSRPEPPAPAPRANLTER